MADFIDEATSNEIAERFARRIAEVGTVFWLRSSAGAAQSESNNFVDAEDRPCSVLLFFSDAAYARSVQKAQYPGYEVAEMDLFGFLFRWLSGMGEDHVIAGLNWRADLCGPERDPLQLRELVIDLLPPTVREAFLQQLAATESTKGA